MARVAFLVGEMFEDSEFRVPYDRVRNAGHKAVIVGVTAGKKLAGKRGKETIKTERAAKDVAADELDALVIPGGYSPDHLRTSAEAVGLVRGLFHRNKPVAAICHAGWMLVEAGLADGRTLTSWPSLKTDLLNAGARWVDREVVEDENLITSRKPDDLPAFCDALLRQIERGVPKHGEPERGGPEAEAQRPPPGPQSALAHVVRYLKAHSMSFRLSSRPSPELLPAVAHAVPPAGRMVETQVVLAGGQPAIACAARGAKLSLPRLSHELGVEVLEGRPADLPPPYGRAGGPVPPLGGAMGALTIVDTEVTNASAIAFMAFSITDIIELPYDQFARLERPRIASFAIGGELSERSAAEEPTRRVA